MPGRKITSDSAPVRHSSRPGRRPDPGKHLAILNAARSLLYREGPGKLTMEAVAREAGVSKVTVYARFANRDELLDAVIGQQANAMITSLSLAPASLDNIRGALRDFGRQLLGFVLSEEHKGFLQLIAGNPGTPRDLLERIYRSGPEATHSRLEDWMRQADAEGLAHFPDPARSTERLIGMLLGLELIRMLYDQPLAHDGARLEAHVSQVVDDFLRLHAG